MSSDPNSSRTERTATTPPRSSQASPRSLSEDDEKMIVLQSWYQRMSPERIGRHQRIPVAEVRQILARRMGGSC